ncbi:hypothetical protein [Streptomyces sp. PTD5-9]|uniref:hypothetical protein n=1 Tax=Streptomyces sp. PTD5-9 TaxID=3120150 RepID=UPI00300B4B3D
MMARSCQAARQAISAAVQGLIPGASIVSMRVKVTEAVDHQVRHSWQGSARALADRILITLHGTAETSEEARAGLTVYRAEHDAIVAGLYTTAEAAQQHCEALVSREYPDTVALFFEWCVDDADPAGLELDICVDGDRLSTGYTVTPLEVATAYDPDADE